MKIKKTINLLPPEVRFRYRKKETKTNKIYIPLFVALLIFFVLIFFISKQIKEYKNEIQKYEGEIKSVQERYLQLENEIDEAYKLKDKIAEGKDYYNSIKQLLGHNDESFSVSDTLRLISLVIPDDVWLYRMQYDDSTYEILLNGETFSNELIKEFLLGLENSSVFSKIELVSSKAVRNEGVLLMDFQIKGLVLKD